VGSSKDGVKTKTIIVASPLSTHCKRKQQRLVGPGIRILCTGGVTGIYTDCCFSELVYPITKLQDSIDTVKLDSPDAVLILGDFNDKCNK
jgi:tRNA pseudouridine-54 N-methylase